ncbi:hypothetical protein HELRODRAFT_85174, partial [Helobdella robusta]|uniref:Antistasin-like domain-containing protein n=1 Tax=Helobdella robusta TaxID=6412 RepID=T1G5T8_HELRO
CSEAQCRMLCPNGFMRDHNGCEICKCNECDGVLCRMYCANGFQRDANGCEICRCN